MRWNTFTLPNLILCLFGTSAPFSVSFSKPVGRWEAQRSHCTFPGHMLLSRDPHLRAHPWKGEVKARSKSDKCAPHLFVKARGKGALHSKLDYAWRSISQAGSALQRGPLVPLPRGREGWSYLPVHSWLLKSLLSPPSSLNKWGWGKKPLWMSLLALSADCWKLW